MLKTLSHFMDRAAAPRDATLSDILDHVVSQARAEIEADARRIRRQRMLDLAHDARVLGLRLAGKPGGEVAFLERDGTERRRASSLVEARAWLDGYREGLAEINEDAGGTE